MKYTPQIVPNVDSPIKAWLDTEHRRIAQSVGAITEQMDLLADVAFSGDYNDLTNLPTLVTDHGALSGLSDDDHPQYAGVADTETITGTWTFTGAGIDITRGLPYIRLNETDAATDEKIYALQSEAGNLFLRTRDDAGANGEVVMQVNRTGTVVDNVTFPNGQVLIDVGTEAAPGLSFNGDPDTGIYRAGTNIMDLVTNGDAQVRVAPSSNPLRVGAQDGVTIGANFLSFYEGDNFTTRKGYIGFAGSAGVSDVMYLTQEEAADLEVRTLTSTGSIFIKPNNVSKITANNTGVSFWGMTPAARPDYTVTNPSTDRALNVTADTLAQVAAVLGTLIADLIAIGLLQ